MNHKNYPILYMERIKGVLYTRIFELFLRELRNKIICRFFAFIPKREAVVDLGCGNGKLLSYLSPFVKVSIGIDRVPNAKLPNFILADISRLPLRNCSVDVAVCTSVLEHLSKLEKAVDEIERIIKPYGYLIVGYPLETLFIRALWRLFVRRSLVREPGIIRPEEFHEDPRTHKTNLYHIEKVLRGHFTVAKASKILPFLPAYKVVKLVRSTLGS